MPQVVKQTAKPAVKAPSPNGSILSQAIPVSELVESYIKLVIYGQNRVGKTSLACDFPKPLLLVAFEPNKTGGAQSVKKVKGVTYLKITSSDGALKLADELSRDTTFKTHVLDGATSLQDILLQEILGVATLPEMLKFKAVSGDQYRARSEKLREVLRPFLNLNAHTVVLAKEKDHNPPKGDEIWEGYGKRKVAPKIDEMRVESFFAADVGSATAGWLHDACDYIARLYLAKKIKVTQQEVVVGNEKQTITTEEDTGKVVHRLRTLYHPNYAAGFRSCNPSKVPEYIELPEGGDYNGKAFALIKAVIDG